DLSALFWAWRTIEGEWQLAANGGGGARPFYAPEADKYPLGKLIKDAGHSQDVVYGAEWMRVEWYSSFRELRQGLLKNSFAGTEYRIGFVVVATLCHLLFSLWPFIAPFVLTGWAAALHAAAALTLIAMALDSARFFGLRRWVGLTYPLGALVFFYILWSATLKTIRDGGIVWRGTRYSLEELRANKV
ncbi:MAG: hypothetical protein JO317_06910, partial [Verrucomicrobiae bacterium]|nr:hypothetical protein [Verrucomicrobiae bacterium]